MVIIFLYYFRKLKKITPVITLVKKIGLQHCRVCNHGVCFALTPQWQNCVGKTIALLSTIDQSSQDRPNLVTCNDINSCRRHLGIFLKVTIYVHFVVTPKLRQVRDPVQPQILKSRDRALCLTTLPYIKNLKVCMPPKQCVSFHI